ncbi:MAG: hypothetical protein PHV85_08800 [Desulfovibrionaceae bacterium]|nr:hypothetical protein [Desulfovibrionaceae bacterium]
MERLCLGRLDTGRDSRHLPPIMAGQGVQRPGPKKRLGRMAFY